MAKNKREKGENSGSNKGVGILIGVLIVITWLSVMCLLIKCDVGGFGSRVLRPVFKDVPMINKILPDASLGVVPQAASAKSIAAASSMVKNFFMRKSSLLPRKPSHNGLRILVVRDSRIRQVIFLISPPIAGTPAQ